MISRDEEGKPSTFFRKQESSEGSVLVYSNQQPSKSKPVPEHFLAW